MNCQALDAAATAEVLHSPTPTAHYRVALGEQQPLTSPRMGELRPPPQRYSSHTAHLACQTRVAKCSIPKDSSSCTHRVPRTAVLWRILAAMIVVLVFIQAVSCGMFFCVRVPFGQRPYVDYRDLISELDAGTPSEAADAGKPVVAAASVTYIQQQLSAPKLIPRAIHQTSHSTRLSTTAKQLMRSWKERNGDTWQVRFYNDDACLNFVRREFPEYFEAYMNLPKDVERADFFRYMVLLRLGGVYADIDVECRQPLDSVIQPADTLLVGWDDEVGDVAAATQRSLARQRQVASWFFAAAPGHPVLRQVCDHIARNAMTVFSNNTVRDTLERTGQGVFTDMVLQWALQHPPAKRDDPWKVRILPRVAFGVRPSEPTDELRPDLPGVVVLHHFLGSWQGMWPAHRKALQTFLPWVRSRASLLEPLEHVLVSNATHYPVSVDFYPPFTMMTDLVGTGDKQAAADVSAAITAHGTWQPAVAPFRRPAVVEALVGALSRHSSSASNSPAAAAAGDKVAAAAIPPTSARARGSTSTSSSGSSADASAPGSRRQVHSGVLVDIGAGHGFFSLAAAARGHRVLAFETSPGSLAALKASIKYNGFEGFIDVHKAVLGATVGTVCLQHQEPAAADTAVEQDTSSTHGVLQNAAGAAADDSDQTDASQHQLPTKVTPRQRGYPSVAQSTAASSDGSACAVKVPKLRLSEVLANNTGVAVVRISADGHEGWIIEGAVDHLRTKHKPAVIYVEFWPAAMRAAGYNHPQQLLQQLYDLGYTDIAHAGHVCDQRWLNVTQVMRSRGTFSVSAHNIAQQQPTWCKLRPENFQLMVKLVSEEVPENVLFVLGHEAGQLQQSPNSTVAADSGQGSSAGSGASMATERDHNGSTDGERNRRIESGDHELHQPAATTSSAASAPEQQASGTVKMPNSSNSSTSSRQVQTQQQVLSRSATELDQPAGSRGRTGQLRTRLPGASSIAAPHG